MNRSTLLKAAAALPLLGPLLMKASPVTEEMVGEEAEVITTRYAMVTRGGQYLETERWGWPELREIEDAAEHGFDRMTIWSNIRGALYASPTRLGLRPTGWWSVSNEQLQGYLTEAGLNAPQSLLNHLNAYAQGFARL